MRVLLDECVPRKFRNFLPDYDCHTVPEQGLAGKKNGELLSLAEKSGFQVFLTLDRGLEYEQNLQQRPIAVILIRAKSSRLADLSTHSSEILRVLRSIQPGELIKVG
jgi:predicted nuclease of predicted toxin-antitoxin system